MDQSDQEIFDQGPQEEPIADEVMTSVEAAKYLKVHVKTVCLLAKEGKIPAKKVGTEWRFLRATLDSWLAEVMD